MQNIRRCPVCGQFLESKKICVCCGYDPARDYEIYPTLKRIPENSVSFSAKRLKWESKDSAKLQESRSKQTFDGNNKDHSITNGTIESKKGDGDNTDKGGKGKNRVVIGVTAGVIAALIIAAIFLYARTKKVTDPDSNEPSTVQNESEIESSNENEIFKNWKKVFQKLSESTVNGINCLYASEEERKNLANYYKNKYGEVFMDTGVEGFSFGLFRDEDSGQLTEISIRCEDSIWWSTNSLSNYSEKYMPENCPVYVGESKQEVFNTLGISREMLDSITMEPENDDDDDKNDFHGFVYTGELNININTGDSESLSISMLNEDSKEISIRFMNGYLYELVYINQS